jgi:hypothetical protein
MRNLRLPLVAAIVAALAATAVAAPAQTPAGSPSTRERAWELGGKLSLAALGAANGAPAASVDRVFQNAKEIGAGLGVDLPPLPVRSLDKSKAQADTLDYLLKQAGSPIAEKLGASYGADHAALFEVAVKSNLLLMLYSPGEQEGKTIAELIRKRAPDAKLPEELWRDVPTKIAAGAYFDDVKKAVAKMQSDVRKYLAAE